MPGIGDARSPAEQVQTGLPLLPAAHSCQQRLCPPRFRFCLCPLLFAPFDEWVGLLAGIFESTDTLHAVYRFVFDSLAPDTSTTFVLQTQHDRTRLEDTHDVTLKKANLVPSATLVPVGPALQLNAAMVKAATQFA